MIKIVFTYETHVNDLNELFHKFQASGASEFNSDVNNEGIQMFKKVDGDIVTIVLDIYYRSVEDYEARTAFERSQPKWNEIWFSDAIKHTLKSVEVFECL